MWELQASMCGLIEPSLVAYIGDNNDELIMLYSNMLQELATKNFEDCNDSACDHCGGYGEDCATIDYSVIDYETHESKAKEIFERVGDEPMIHDLVAYACQIGLTTRGAWEFYINDHDTIPFIDTH